MPPTKYFLRKRQRDRVGRSRFDRKRTSSLALPGRLATLVLAAGFLGSLSSTDVSRAADPPPFAEVCFDDFDLVRNGCPSRERIEALFERVRQHRGQISETEFRDLPVQQLKGLFRFKPRWRSDTVLRLLLANQKRFGIHFWSGKRGVLLRYHHDHGRAWSAYGTTRSDNGPLPETFSLWALDNGRYSRAGQRTIEIRHHDGELFVSHGEVVLLRAPLAGPPREIYFEGEVDVRGLAVARSGPPPIEPSPRPVVWRSDRPAELAWQFVRDEETGGPEFRFDDGRLTLAAKAETPHGRAFVDLTEPGFHEFIFEVDTPQPGTGVFLGDRLGNPLAVIAFYKADKLGFTTFAPMDPSGNAWGKQYNVDYHIIPRAGPKQWLRLVAGAGSYRYATSGDGVHFSYPTDGARSLRGACRSVGLLSTTTSDTKDRSLTLRSIRVRRLEVLSSLVDASMMRRVGPLEVAADFDDWEARVTESRPPDISPHDWRRACLIYSLMYNSGGGHRILDELLEALIEEDRPPKWKLQLLEEATLLANFSAGDGQENLGRRFDALYRKLGRQLARDGHLAPFSVINRAMLRSSGWNKRIDAFPRDLLRHELIALTQCEQWQRAAEVCRRVRYYTWLDEFGRNLKPQRFTVPDGGQLVRWASAQAAVHDPEAAAGAEGAESNALRHPLEPRVGKIGFNALQELRSAAEAGAYEAACRTLGAVGTQGSDDLVLDPNDRRLLVSLPLAVRGAMRRWPGLRAAMREHFGPLGDLRAEQAIGDSDPAAARAVCIQFASTPAAAEAYQWLGDRALARGLAGEAMAAYRDSVRAATPEQFEAIQPRLRLCGAMLGRDVGEPPKTAVEIGAMRMSSGRFEQTAARLRQARGGETEVDSAPVVPPAPPPGNYELRQVEQFDLSSEKLPEEMPEDFFEEFQKEGLDLVARRLSVRPLGQRLLLTTGQQQAVFEPAAGRTVWSQRSDVDEVSLWWLLRPMPSKVLGDAVFHCRLGFEEDEPRSELVCRQLGDGKEVWTRPEGPLVVSDMLPVGRRLFALTASRDLGWQLTLRLARFDPATGREQSAQVVARFRDHWEGALPARAVLADHLVVASVGGAVICCDLGGRVRWIRRQIIMPPAEKLKYGIDWLRQVHRRPLIVDDRVYATQPGVWAVESIDLESGSLKWRRPLCDVVCVVGQVADRLIVETTGGLAALDPATGDVVWRHETPAKADMRVCGGPDGLCYAAVEQVDDEESPRRPMLVWVDPEQGNTLTETTLEVPETKFPLPGPLVAVGDGAWLFLATGEKRESRAICELVPK